MPSRDAVEFTAAALAGALVALVAVQSLRPRTSRTVRLRRRLRGTVKETRDTAGTAAGSTRQALRDSSRAAGSLGELGREFVRAASDEVGTALRSSPATSASVPGSRLAGALERIRELGRRST